MNNQALRTAFVTSWSIHCISFLTGALGTAIAFILGHFGILTLERLWLVPLIPLLTSFLLGSILTLTAGKRIVRFVESVNHALHQISKGNYEIELKEYPPILELREIIQNFNSMTKELASTELLRSDFIENVSHEFKTPLTAIEGYATLLQQKNLTEEKRIEYTQKILLSTRRLNTMTGNILLLSRLENQELEISKERYSLDEQLRETILLLEPAWSGKAIELDIDLADCDYTANRELMAQVWQNILGNAMKFSPEKGVIQIRLHNAPNQVVITVADNGPGMSEEVMGRVFEKFYQGDASRSAQGNGLGLPLAKRIIDLHSGSIEVQSQVGLGATFRIILPAL